jgi:hypothetical protein
MTLYADKPYGGAYPWKLIVQKHFVNQGNWTFVNEPARFFRNDKELEEYLFERSQACDKTSDREYVIGIIDHEYRGLRMRDPLLHHSRRLMKESDTTNLDNR